MYLLYADESGSIGDRKQKHFVLAGFCVFERESYWLSEKIDKVARRINPADPSSLEFHGSPMYGGKGVWRSIPKTERIDLMRELLQVVHTTHRSTRLFICAVNKERINIDDCHTDDPIRYCFEQIGSRFDSYLRRMHLNNDKQRGIMIFDQTSYEKYIQGLAADFQSIGHEYGRFRNFSEVPLFLDSKASRLVQLADLIAYATFRKYELEDSCLFDIFKERIDCVGDRCHGLHAML
jgi:hypothetical protein